MRNQQKELRKAKATAQARGAGGKSQETEDRGKEETEWREGRVRGRGGEQQAWASK